MLWCCWGLMTEGFVTHGGHVFKRVPLIIMAFNSVVWAALFGQSFREHVPVGLRIILGALVCANVFGAIGYHYQILFGRVK